MNRGVSLFIAAILLAAVAAFYFQVDRPAQERKAEETERGEVFVAVPRDRVDAIEIVRGEGTVRLERDAARRWWLRAPEVAPARPAAVTDLLDEATTTHVLRRLTATGAERAELGLDAPAARLHLMGEGIDVELQVGRDAPVLDGRYYLGRNDGDEVIVTASPLRQTLQEPIDDLRRRRLFDVPRWRVVTIEQVEGEHRLRLRKGEDGVWQIEEPDLGRADRDRVGKWLDALEQAEAPVLTPLAGDGPPADVPGPWARLHLTSGGEEQAITLVIAQPPEGDAVAYQEGLGFFGTLPADSAAALVADGRALRDRHLATFHAYEVDRIEIVGQDGALALRHEDGRWTADDGRRIDGPIVDEYLRDLEKSEGTRYRNDTSGLEGNDRRVRLFAGTKLLTDLGFALVEPVVRRLPDGPIFELEPQLYSRLLPTIHRFADHLSPATSDPAPEALPAPEPPS
jgi:hypothetical protein